VTGATLNFEAGLYMTRDGRPSNPPVAPVTDGLAPAALPSQMVGRSLTTMRRRAIRCLALAALGGQLAAIADALFVEHVTCPEHGDRIHVSVPARAPVATAWATVGAAVVGAADDHDQCLLDEEGGRATSAPPPAPRAPIAARAPSLALELTPPVLRRAPLYRLAPKNSPPDRPLALI
jgi:hypothetical protein